ncbi:MAG: hypothetical protein KAQ83_03650 [Nanoarchaeota archaeon]|nr:hypothetical protein [Nanoarchaeota archaeon]
MPEEAKQMDPDRVLKGVLVGVIVIAILTLVAFLLFIGNQASVAGEAINVLTEIRMGQVEDMNATEFDSREYCMATVARSGSEMAIFLYNCE